MSQETMQPCMVCGGTLRWETREETLVYKGHEKKIQTEAWWCSSCGEGIITGQPLLESERAFLQLKAEADGVLVMAAPLRSAKGTPSRRSTRDKLHRMYEMSEATEKKEAA